ncbi:hypothetical protein PoB_002554600 [Plakobranchus ocellatus]|uniref:Uncharacterized protein n=1 Tax=Plakobranchus ocellatus TaxID=259542 RepID=A0AAV3ZWW7_9GAST|nr:hypothetical protein PoB_002554600 [Plakobranchus ocellatus]
MLLEIPAIMNQKLRESRRDYNWRTISNPTWSVTAAAIGNIMLFGMRPPSVATSCCLECDRLLTQHHAVWMATAFCCNIILFGWRPPSVAISCCLDGDRFLSQHHAVWMATATSCLLVL